MKTIVITEAGAKGDGCTDDAPVLQRVMDTAPCLIEVPPGRYLIGKTLRIRSHTNIKADAKAVIVLADGAMKTADDYLIANYDPEGGDRDISIDGGTWDGNNAGNPRPTGGLFADGYTGALLHFRNVSDFQLTNMHFANAEAYYARFTLAYRFRIEGIRFSSNRVRHNNDGIHLGGFCGDGIIRDIKGLHADVTGDDMVALNADDAPRRNEVRGMLCGPIRDIVIEDIEAENCHTFVRLLSVWSPIERIRISGVRGTCAMSAINCDAARGCRVKLFDEAHPPYPDGVGMLRDIDISDVAVAKSEDNHAALVRLETRMERCNITGLRRMMDVDRSPSSPTVRVQKTRVGRLRLEPGGVDTSLSVDGLFESHSHDIVSLSADK
jgi:polygalacturonase